MKKMRLYKRILAYLFCVVMTLHCMLPAATCYAETAGDELTVGVPSDRCPVFYTDSDTDEIVGIGVDIMRLAAEKAGYSASFIYIEEDTLKEALDNSSYDVLLPFGSAVKSDSGAPSVISDALIQTPFTLVTLGKGQLADINHLRVGMLRSLTSAAETVRELYPGVEIDLYETMQESVDALRGARVDALLHNSYVWSYVLQKPAYSDLIVQPAAMFTMDFCAGTLDTENGRIIIDRLNKGIGALSDTSRQAVILDYTSRRLYNYELSDYFYMYWLIILLIMLLFISLIIIMVQRMRALRREQEKQLHQLIYQDPLTGALSLYGFRKRAEELLNENPDMPYLILYANIKNFKFINDRMGKSAGDELLCFMADKIREVITDKEAMCRLECDHFIVMRCISNKAKIEQEYTDVIGAVSKYFINRGMENRVQVCSGIYVMTPEDYRSINIDHMIDLARVAEKRIRNTLKKEGYEFYNPEQWEKGKRNIDIISHLHSAMEDGEIEVWYQPQVNYDTGEIIGAEALCRWNHAKLGWISPGEFIPTLEEAGLIHELDFFVWERVCQDLQRWNREGKHRSVSVNLSRCDITAEPDIPKHFRDLLEKYELSPDQLRIEITESVYVEDPAILINTTEKLHESGFKVEMDDFGSGYSSLNMLKDVPVDRIKLDLHFLTKSENMDKSRTIIRCMVQMVHSLGMGLIAEGVETDDQARFLRSKGCSELQGFYFYKPMSVKDFENVSEKKKPLPS